MDTDQRFAMKAVVIVAWVIGWLCLTGAAWVFGGVGAALLVLALGLLGAGGYRGLLLVLVGGWAAAARPSKWDFDRD
ncbi:MAG: hypothetical protein AAFV77_06540 [Planctomycetota bacterium]